jgi:uncharacterized protein (DUF58 family)
MRAVTRFIHEKARTWALERQGEDEREVTLTTHRVYILPTRQGVAFSVLLVAMLLASLNYNNSLGLALTFLLSGLALVAMHHCHHNMVGLTVRFRGVESVFAGQRAEFRFGLEGRGHDARYQIQLHSDERPEHPAQSAYIDIAAGEHGEAVLPIATARRGRQLLTRLGVSTRYPMGLFRAWSWLHMDCAVLVYPTPAPDAPRVPSGDGDSGGRQDERRGEEDFSGLRDFRSGDSPRHIAWKAYARDQEPRTKQYAGLALSATWLDFDSLQDADPEVRLQKLARQVLEAEVEGSPYGLRLPNATIAPSLGASHQDRCLQALALFEFGTGTAAAASAAAA